MSYDQKNNCVVYTIIASSIYERGLARIADGRLPSDRPPARFRPHRRQIAICVSDHADGTMSGSALETLSGLTACSDTLGGTSNA